MEATLTGTGHVAIPNAIGAALGLRLGDILAATKGEFTPQAITLRPLRALRDYPEEVHLAALAEVQVDHRLFLPAPLRHRLGLKPGDRVTLTTTDGGVLIAPVGRQPKEGR